jgi:hypothetical protein
VNLSWTASTDPVVSGQVTSGVAGYNIYRNGTFVTSVTGTSYSDTGLLSSGTYTYNVSAYDAAGNNSDPATSASVTTPAGPITYISNLQWVGTPVNGWGPAEIDMSNGEQAARDGSTISLHGVKYAKGLGVHANSVVTYNLGGQYSRFVSDVGIDDEVCTGCGSVVFQVWADGTKLYDSGAMTQASPTQNINVSVAGTTQLQLVVNVGATGDNDHADWAGAYLYTGTQNAYSLTVSQAGTGSGTVATSPAETIFNAGDLAHLTATANAGSIFAGWSGGVCSVAGDTFTDYALSDSSWTFVNASYNPGTRLLQENSSNGPHGSYLSLTAPPVGAAFVVEVQPAGRNWVSIGVNYNGNMNGYMYFDLQNGVSGSYSNIAGYGIKPLGGGWYELSVALEANGDAYIGIASGNNSPSYQGDGASGVLVRNPRFIRFKEGKSVPHALSSSPVQVTDPYFEYMGGVALGDSFTANANYTKEINNTSVHLLVADMGVSADEPLAEIVGRFGSYATPYSPSFALLMGGITDINQAGSDPNAAMQAQVQSFVSQCNSINAIPVLTNLPPESNNSSWSSQKQGWINTYNSWISNYALANGYVLLDLKDLLSTDGLTLSAAYDSGDHLHPNTAGYNAIGDKIVSLLDGVSVITPSCMVPMAGNTAVTATFNVAQ